jgi:hypothetical protein
MSTNVFRVAVNTSKIKDTEYFKYNMNCEIWGSHVDEDDNAVLLGCDAMQTQC